jgi:hypothetical protein
MAQQDHNDKRDELLLMVGQIVLISQTTEKVIRLCLTFVIQEDAPLTLEKLEFLELKEKKKTIGYFLSELRKRASLDEDFDQLLIEFLEKRNTLIHNVEDVPGWSLENSSGRIEARKFLGKLAFLTVEVLKIFTGLVRAWQNQVGIDTSDLEIQSEFFSEIDRQYTPLIDSLLSEKLE